MKVKRVVEGVVLGQDEIEKTSSQQDIMSGDEIVCKTLRLKTVGLENLTYICAF